MSFYASTDMFPTRGSAYAAFRPGTQSPMLPQALYRPGAAGPRFLTGLGDHQYMTQLRRPIVPTLRGLGDPISDLLGGSADAIVEQVVVRSWPFIQKQMQPMMMPIQVGAVLGAMGSVTAAVFAYLAWKQARRPAF